MSARERRCLRQAAIAPAPHAEVRRAIVKRAAGTDSARVATDPFIRMM